MASLSQYAKHRGCSRTAVQSAIATGRITAASAWKGSRGWWEIDVAAADKEWSDRTNPGKQRKNHREKGRQKGQPELFDTDREPATDPPISQTGPKSPDMVKAAHEKLTYQGKLARIVFLEKCGDLADVASMRTEAFSVARLIRDALLRIPARLGPELAGEIDAHRCTERVYEEIESALQKLTEVEVPE